MTFNNVVAYSTLFSICLFMFACEHKDDDKMVEGTGSVNLRLEHLWNQADFSLNTTYVHPKTMEEISMSKFKYYLSNIKLKKTNGTWWHQVDSYSLVDLSTSTSPEISLTNIPKGDYTAISFTIGVDSAHNVSGSQLGALSPAKNMFLDWNLGYVFILAEGTSPATPLGAFHYQVSGFKKSNASNAVQTDTLVFTPPLLSIAPNALPVVHFSVSLDKIWSAGFTLNSIPSIVSEGENAIQVAKNFKDAFEIEHIHN